MQKLAIVSDVTFDPGLIRIQAQISSPSLACEVPMT
jgi:hypothetical protein